MGRGLCFFRRGKSENLKGGGGGLVFAFLVLLGRAGIIRVGADVLLIWGYPDLWGLILRSFRNLILFFAFVGN